MQGGCGFLHCECRLLAGGAKKWVQVWVQVQSCRCGVGVGELSKLNVGAVRVVVDACAGRGQCG